MTTNNYILISGPTGVGKSSLISELTNRLPKIKVYSDPYINNPFISQAYTSHSKCFQSQVFFLKEFAKLHKEINSTIESSPMIIQERSIYESVEIFCRNLYIEGLFSKDELLLMRELLEIVETEIIKPKKVFLLEASPETIFSRINKRNRSFENNLTLDFIIRQQRLYNDWRDTVLSNWSSEIYTILTDNYTPKEVCDQLLKEVSLS